MKINKIITSVIVFCMLVIGTSMKVDAGSFSVSGGGSVSAGSKSTVTISVQGAAGTFTISATNGAKVSTSSIYIDDTSASVTVTAPSSGNFSVSVKASDVTSFDGVVELPGGGYEGSAVTGTKSASFTVKTSSSSGSSSSGSSGSSSSGSSSSGSSSSGSSSSGSSSSTEEPEETKSDDATLKSLTVDQGTLSPEFSASKTDYTVTVMDKEEIKISATTNDSNAEVSGTGTKELNLGANEFDIKVTAEDGSTKTYTVNVTMDKEPTVYEEYGDTELGFVQDTSSAKVPQGFEETKITIDDQEMQAWNSGALGVTIVYLSDAEGNKDFYIYDEGVQTKFVQLGLLGKNIVLINIPTDQQERVGMKYETVTVDGTEMMGWTFTDEEFANYVIIRVLNEIGEEVEYLYSIEENTMILNPKQAPVSVEEYAKLVKQNDQLELNAMIAYVSAGVLGVVALGAIIMLVRTKKANKKIVNMITETINSEE